MRVLAGGVGGAKSNDGKKNTTLSGGEVAVIAVLVGGRERGAGS
jgi:hypothetical protein